MDIEAALRDGYTLEEVNQELARRVKFNYSAAKEDGYTDEDILKELQRRSGTGKSTKLVDQIPGLAPEVKAKETEYTVGEKALGLGETALSQVTGLTTGGLGFAGGAVKGILSDIANGRIGTSQATAEQSALAGAQALTYEPRTQAGQEYNEAAGKVIGEVMPGLIPVMPQLEALGAAKALSARKLTPAEEMILKGRREAQEGIPEAPVTAPVQMPQMQQELPLGQPNQFGIRPSEMVPDENGIPIRPQESLEAQTTSRQGDLFSQEAGETFPAMIKPETTFDKFDLQQESLPFDGPGFTNTPEPRATAQEALRTSHNYPTEEFQLRQEALESPEVQTYVKEMQAKAAELQKVVDNAISPAVREKAQTELNKLQQEFGQEMERYGVRNPQDTWGRGLYESRGENTTGQIVHTFTPEKKPLGQSGFGKGQRGSIGFFGEDPFESFSKKIKEQIPDATPEEIQKAWDSEKKTTFKQLDIKPTLTKDDALKALQMGDDSDTLPNPFERHLMSQGYMPAEATKNQAVKAGITYVKQMFDDYANQAQRALYDSGQVVKGRVEGMGLINALTRAEKLGGFNLKDVLGLRQQWYEAKGNPEYQFNFNKQQQKIHELKTQLDARMLQEINSVLPPEKQIQALPNYITSVYDGKFWGTVNIRGAEGRPLIVASDNKLHLQHLLKKYAGEGYATSKIKTRGAQKSDNLLRQNQGANYQYMIDMLTDENPQVRQLYGRIAADLQGKATTTAGRHQRLKDWHGYEGEVGNRPWRTDKQNYYDMKRMLVDQVESHYSWMASQKAAEFAKEVINPKSKVPENNRQIITDYINNNILGKRLTNPIDEVVYDFVESVFKSSPKQTKEVVRSVANLETALITACGSPIHALQNVVQPITVILPQMMKEKGFHPVDVVTAMAKGAAEYAYVFTGKQIGEFLKPFDVTVGDFAGSKNFKEKYQYAKDTGVINPTLVEATSSINNKALNTAYQMATQGILSRPSEQAARWTTFSTMADFLQKRGYSKADAFNRARQITETYMVDYGPDAKANIWKSLGIFGEVAGRLQSFATNQMSQAYVYAKHSTKSLNDFAAFATYIGTLYTLGGVAGIPGFDVLEKVVNSLKSKDGESFSLKNYLRQTIGNSASEGIWGSMGIGAAPAFAGKVLKSDSNMPAFMGVPMANIMTEQGRAIGKRLFGEQRWAEEPSSEQAHEIAAFSPASTRPLLESKFLTANIGGKEKILSPKTNEPLHTKKEGEFSFGNIKSRERVRDTELANEQFKEQQYMREHKKNLETEIRQLALDTKVYGKSTPEKEARLNKVVTDYATKYSGNVEELVKDLKDLGVHLDNKDIAMMVKLGNQKNLSPEQVRLFNFHKKYQEMRTK